MGNLRVSVSIIHKRLIFHGKHEESKYSLTSDMNPHEDNYEMKLDNLNNPSNKFRAEFTKLPYRHT